MNHALWKATGARVLALTFVIAGAVACDRGDTDANTRTTDNAGLPSAASPSAQVVGTTPAPPSTANDTAQTVPVAPAARGDVSKQADNVARPLEGDSNSYSTVAPITPQKADGVNSNGSNK